MTVYSHSRLSCYEQCPKKYKLKYIDKVETELEESIEGFLGSCVHEALEQLYQDLLFEKLMSLEELLSCFDQIWEENWDDAIVIVKEDYTARNYQAMGRRFLRGYYQRYHPFDQGKTIALEERVLLSLDEEGHYKLQGYIDRLVENAEGCYEIHDYKTNSRLPLPEYLESDRQLALYALGVKERYPDVREIRLVWHFLAFDKEIVSTRTDEELQQLKQQVIQLIDSIEADDTYAACPSRLCDWCEFKPLCPQWSHLFSIKGKEDNEYLNDSGVKLVDRYAELKQKQKQIRLDLYAELEKLEEALLHFAENEGAEVVFGTKNKIRIKEQQQYKFPAKHSKKRQQLIEVLKKSGKWDEVVQLDTTALNKIIQSQKWDTTLLDELKKFSMLDCSKRLYVSKLREQ